jgi:DNA mismatch repair protein MutS
VRNATVAVKEWEGEVIFLHEVRPGAADRSYGVQVARLAGLPPPWSRARAIVLDALESGDRERRRPRRNADRRSAAVLRRRAPRRRRATSGRPERARRRLAGVHARRALPREALDLIYELKAMSDSD